MKNLNKIYNEILYRDQYETFIKEQQYNFLLDKLKQICCEEIATEINDEFYNIFLNENKHTEINYEKYEKNIFKPKTFEEYLKNCKNFV